MGVWPGSNLVVKMLRQTKYYFQSGEYTDRNRFSKTCVNREGLSVKQLYRHKWSIFIMHSDQISQ